MSRLSGRLAANLLWLVLFSIGVVAAAFLTFVSGVLFDDSYLVSVPMPEAGGVLPQQEVTVLGRSVGQVKDVELTREGVMLTLEIDGEREVPAEADVKVLRRSPIGEQAIDFHPLAAGWKPAEPGVDHRAERGRRPGRGAVPAREDRRAVRGHRRRLGDDGRVRARRRTRRPRPDPARARS